MPIPNCRAMIVTEAESHSPDTKCAFDDAAPQPTVRTSGTREAREAHGVRGVYLELNSLYGLSRLSQRWLTVDEERHGQKLDEAPAYQVLRCWHGCAVRAIKVLQSHLEVAAPGRGAKSWDCRRRLVLQFGRAKTKRRK